MPAFISSRRAALPLLLSALVLAGCETEDPPTPWEIIKGTAPLTISAAVHPTTRVSLATYPSRTGTLTIADDSTTSGWIRMAAGDTVFLTGAVVKEGSGWIVTFDDLVPAEYNIITSGDYPDTYGLVSTAILTSDVTGDAVAEQHRIYWQFER